MTLVGAIMAPRWSYIAPNIVFNAIVSFQVVIMALLSGMHRLWGPVLGVIPMVILSEFSVDDLPAGTITTEQYLSMPHVVAQFPYGRLNTHDEQYLQRIGLKRNVAVTTPTFTLVPLFVIGTDRIATVHSRLAFQCAQYLPLKILPSPIKIPVLREVLQWQPHLATDPALHWLRDLLRRTAADIEPLDKKATTLLNASRNTAVQTSSVEQQQLASIIV